MKKTDVEKETVEEIIKSCSLNFVERIVVRIFYKEFVKVYNIERIKWMNIWLN